MFYLAAFAQIIIPSFGRLIIAFHKICLHLHDQTKLIICIYSLHYLQTAPQ